MNGYLPSRKLLEAIEKFPTPKSITDIRSWFGLVNQVAYSFARTKPMAPLRDLLSTKNRTFYWDSALDGAFKASKEEILRLTKEGVRAFEVNRPTCLLTDWAKIGVGFTLLQKHCDCKGKQLTPECGPDHWKLVFAGSRFTSPTEKRYAPIEGEALALVHGLESCRMFVLGCPSLTIGVDHKPLLKFFNDRELESIANPRMFALKQRSLMYRFNIEYVPGGHNCAADATSRYPVGVDEASTEESTIIEGSALAATVSTAQEIRSVTWEVIRDAAIADAEVVDLVNLIEDGFPERRSDVVEHLRIYWPLRNDLYTVGNVPLLDHKVLIPNSLRKEVLGGLHAAHQCVAGMAAHARQRFFWPGINAAIRQVRAQCTLCNANAPSQSREPMILSAPPDVPFQQVVTDLCEVAGHDYMIYADRYSGWVEIAKLSGKAFKDVTRCMLKWFSDFGVPEEVASDGGPPFNSSSYDAFLKLWDIRKRQSSAHFPQSNGRAEVAVKTAKRILLGNIDSSGNLDTVRFCRGLLAYRNTPQQDVGLSCAEMLYGRTLRDHLPNQDRKLRLEWRQIAAAREAALAKKHLTHPPEQSGRALSTLQPGQAVQVQNQSGNRPGKWDHTGVVVEVLQHRQYKVLMDGSRRITLRNRRFLRCIDPVTRKLFQIEDLPPPNDAYEPSQVLADNSLPRGVLDKVLQPRSEPEAIHTVPAPEVPVVEHHQPAAGVGVHKDPGTGEVRRQAGVVDADKNTGLRRSNRERRAPERLMIQDMRSKSYVEAVSGSVG